MKRKEENVVIDYSTVSQRNYVSELEHRLKDSTDKSSFIHFLMQKISLDDLYFQKQYEKLYYTVALVDYLDCMDKDKKLEYIGKYVHGKLEHLTFSSGVETYCKVVQSDDIKKELLKSAIPEFLKYNLVVTDIEGVV